MASLDCMLTEEYKASLRQLIAATVEKSVRASFAAYDAKRAAEQPTVPESSAALHESADQMERRRRHRIELVEERARRDPVWAEKIARRHAAFRDVPTSTGAPLMATSGSPAPPSVLTACASWDGNLVARPPTTCSTQCPGRAISVSVPAHASTATSASSRVTVGVLPERCCYDLEPMAATSSSTSHAYTSSACVVRDGDFGLTSPLTCSTQGLGRDITVPTQGPGCDITLPVSVAHTATSASSKAAIGVVPEHCYFDPKRATAASTATSTSTASTYILSACAAPDGDLEITSLPTTCSSLRPGSDTSVVTTTCTTHDNCIYPVAHPDDVGDCAPARDFIMTPPTIRTAVCQVVLTQAMLADSGSSDTVSMSTPLPEPEDADTDVTHADEQQLSCSSVELPLAFVTARNVASDHSFVTSSMSAISLPLAAIGFAEVHIASKDDVRLLLKVLEMSLPESKEPFVTSLPPQFTQVIVTCGTNANQLQAKCSGICSCLARTTFHSVFLLPWDPGEKIGVFRDYALSRDSAHGTSLKQLNVYFKDSSDRHRQLGELLWYMFDSVCHFLISSATQQEFLDRYSVTAMVSRLLVLVMMHNGVVLWLLFQSALANTFLVLPWDLGLPLSGMDTKVSKFVHELDVRLTNSSEVTCLQGSSVHEQCSYNIVLETIPNWMVALVELQPWLSSLKSLLAFEVVRGTVRNNHSIVTPLRIMGEGPIRLQYLGEVYDKQYSSCKTLHFVQATHIDYECSAWEIAWYLVETSCTCSELGGSGQVSSKPMLYGHGQKLICIPLFQSTRNTLNFSLVGVRFPCISTTNLPDSHGTCGIFIDWLHSGFTGHKLSVLGHMDCLGELHFWTSWMDQMVLKDDGLKCEPMQLVSSGLIYFGEILDHCNIWLMLWRATENKILLMQFQDAQKQNILFIGSKLSSAANSEMVTGVHSRGPSAMDESDCVAPMNWVVSSTSTYPDFDKRSEVSIQVLRRTVQTFLMAIWVQSCYTGSQSSTMDSAFLVEVAESKYSVLMQRQTWFLYCTPGKPARDTSEPFQDTIQQIDIEKFQLLKVKLGYSVTASYVCIPGLVAWAHSSGVCHCRIILPDYNKVMHVAWDFRGRLFLSVGCGAATDQGKASSSIPWDPGGAVWWRLEDKPPFKEGGMLTPTSTTTVGPKHQCACWYEIGLGQRYKYKAENNCEDLAWNGTASASSALAFSFLSSSSLLCNSLNLENPWL